MTRGWSEAAMGAVLRWRAPDTEVSASQSYDFAGVYSHGGGVFRKHSVPGSSFAYGRLTQLRMNEFVYPKLMAWEGALGVVPESCGGCFVSPEFQVFEVDSTKLLPRFLDFYMRRPRVWSELGRLSPGTNLRRRRLSATEFLKYRISIPPLAEQERLVAHLDAIETRLRRAQQLREDQEQEVQAALHSAFHQLEAHAQWVPMGDVTPVHRRPTEIELNGEYPGLGARSFGKGIFHKPTISGESLTWQKLFQVHAGDIVISNIKAWEGAIAVAGEADHGRYGSHRYLTCVADPKRALPDFVCFYLLSQSGLEQVGSASPGSADRNRTLAMDRLERINVPLVPLTSQVEFKKLLDLRTKLRAEAAQSAQRTAALLPSLLDGIFNS